MSRCIDAHQHFWNYDATRHAWIDDSMHAIQRDFTPDMLQPILKEHGIDGCVNVQVDQTEAETHRMLQWAASHDFIKGVVGWIDLQAPDVADRLAYFAQFPKLKGYRHIVQAEPDSAFMNRPSFRRGIDLLQQVGVTYDILIYPHQLKTAIDLAAAFPQQPFVLDHLAKPYIKKGLIGDWKKDITALAAMEHVYCKISGLVTEGDWQHFNPEKIYPYIESALEVFGPQRIMFGSDWPVCLVAASYSQVLQLVQAATDALSEEEKAAFFGGNATRFYNLEA